MLEMSARGSVQHDDEFSVEAQGSIIKTYGTADQSDFSRALVLAASTFSCCMQQHRKSANSAQELPDDSDSRV